jgi:predicted peptidase
VPAIVVFPQVPVGERWIGEPADVAIAALDRSTKEFNGDPARTYLTGLSMGGYGALHVALAHPDRFAALVVICGGLLPHPTATSVAKSPLIPDDVDPYLYVAKALRKIPVWLFAGADDPTIPQRESRQLEAAFNAVSGDVKFTEFPDTQHNAWGKAYGETALWPWLFAQRRH